MKLALLIIFFIFSLLGIIVNVNIFLNKAKYRFSYQDMVKNEIRSMVKVECIKN